MIQYKVIRVSRPGTTLSDLISELNKLGRRDWQLIHIIDIQKDSHTHYNTREVIYTISLEGLFCRRKKQEVNE